MDKGTDRQGRLIIQEDNRQYAPPDGRMPAAPPSTKQKAEI